MLASKRREIQTHTEGGLIGLACYIIASVWTTVHNYLESINDPPAVGSWIAACINRRLDLPLVASCYSLARFYSGSED